MRTKIAKFVLIKRFPMSQLTVKPRIKRKKAASCRRNHENLFTHQQVAVIRMILVSVAERVSYDGLVTWPIDNCLSKLIIIMISCRSPTAFPRNEHFMRNNLQSVCLYSNFRSNSHDFFKRVVLR
jgi:hypothetical protein